MSREAVCCIAALAHRLVACAQDVHEMIERLFRMASGVTTLKRFGFNWKTDERLSLRSDNAARIHGYVEEVPSIRFAIHGTRVTYAP